MVGSVMRNAVAGAMRQALAPENTQAIASAMTRDLGPAIQKVLSENLAPGIEVPNMAGPSVNPLTECPRAARHAAIALR